MKFSNIWTEEEYKKLKNYLKENIDLKYQSFQKKLIFTNYPILGVRTPILKKIAKEISKTNKKTFLVIKNKESYEEILLEAFVISSIEDIPTSVKYFNQYIKKIDNWALCDLAVSSFKIVKKDKKYFFNLIKKYLLNKNPYIVRVGLVLLINYYIEEEYLNKIFQLIQNIENKDYYVNMAISWLLSICYIKYPDDTLEYLKNSSLDIFIYNKTISKICDSYQVDQKEKEKLKKMRKKKKITNFK